MFINFIYLFKKPALSLIYISIFFLFINLRCLVFFNSNLLFIYLFIFIFIFVCVGSSFLCEGFLQLRQAGATLHRGVRASSLSWPLLLRITGSRRTGSVVVAHGLSCSAACGIFPDQGSNPCPLHQQADSQPLRHQGSPIFLFFNLHFIYFQYDFYYFFPSTNFGLCLFFFFYFLQV